MLRHPISEVKAEALTPAQVAAYRDERLASVSGETTRQDLVLFRQVLDVARREWGLKIRPNPVDDVRKPAPAKARTRRVRYSDLKAIAKGLSTFRNPLLRQGILFALATGMRGGEILRMEWKDVDQKLALLTIPVTRTLRIVAELEATAIETEPLVFPSSAALCGYLGRD